MFESLDFIYTPTADVDAAAAHYCDSLGAELVFRVRAMGTTVAAHLHGERPVLVYRVVDYAEATDALEAAGIELDELEIPHGPCATFRALGDQRFAVYELTRPEAIRHFTGRFDP